MSEDITPLVSPYLFSNSLQSGKLFGIGADDAADAFRVAAITVDYTPTDVLLPASLPLFLVGLAGAAYFSRRRAASA